MWGAYLYFHSLSSDLMGIVICFLSLKSLFSLVLDAIHTEATLNKMTFRKVTSDLNPRLLFFSLDEEPIG